MSTALTCPVANRFAKGKTSCGRILRTVRRPLKIGLHGEHLRGLVEHGCYQQSKAHDPDLELLFTQAETAW